MVYPVVRFVFDRRRNCAKGLKTFGEVEVEILFQRRRKWIATKVKILPSQWSCDCGVIRHPERALLNARLESARRPVLKYIETLMLREEEFSFEGLSAALRLKSVGETFPEYVRRRIVALKGTLKDSTLKDHGRLLGALRGFGRIVTMASLTRDNIVAFDEYLHGRGLCQPSVHAYHKIMKRYVNELVVARVLDRSPYEGMKIERGRSRQRRYLSVEELAVIEGSHTVPATLEKVRDVFLFQCYTGLSYADLLTFDVSMIQERGDRKVIRDTRQKTGEEYFIVLLPPALRILEKYGGRLPVMTNQQYNLRLKALAAAVGLDRRLTSHMGRHTFLTMALNSGVPIEAVSRMAGHTNIKTTQIYATLVGSTMDREFERLEAAMAARSGGESVTEPGIGLRRGNCSGNSSADDVLTGQTTSGSMDAFGSGLDGESGFCYVSVS